MHISVAICTWKRSESLQQTLESLTQLHVPADLQWEVVVINNSDCPATDAVLASFMSRLPLRWERELRLGLSNARNRATLMTRGEFILWTDDDVLVSRNWLSEYAAAMQTYPQADFLGGPIELQFASEPPRWIARNLDIIGGAYASLNLGSQTRSLAPDEEPFGANMAIRRSLLLATAFNPELGPVGASQVRGDESDIFHRLSPSRNGIWVGSAPVVHCIPRERTTLSYLWNYYEGYGRTLVRRNIHQNETGGGEPRYIVAHSRLAFSVPWPSRHWVRAMRKSAILSGIYRELKQLRDKVDKGIDLAVPQPSIARALDSKAKSYPKP